MSVTLLVTGHRPNRLGGYSPAVTHRVDALALRLVGQIQPDHALIGMAQGWDQACAAACVALSVPFTAVIPGSPGGQTFGDNWPRAARDRYDTLVARAARVVQCRWPGGNLAYHARDEKMVDLAVEAGDALCLALWNGQPSGTSVTVRMARAWGIPVWNAWGEWTL